MGGSCVRPKNCRCQWRMVGGAFPGAPNHAWNRLKNHTAARHQNGTFCIECTARPFEDDSKTIVWSVQGIPLPGSPTANINAPAAVVAYSTVILNGTRSIDPTASIKSYAWKQTAGPTVTLSKASASQATFIAPPVAAVTAFTFSLSVTDSSGAASSASTTINVSPASRTQLVVTFVSREAKRKCQSWEVKVSIPLVRSHSRLLQSRNPLIFAPVGE